MTPVVAQIWDLSHPCDWTPAVQIAEAREAWNAHTYKATWSSFAIAFFTIQEMIDASADHPKALCPDPPPDPVLLALGDRRRATQVAQDTWEVIAGLATGEALGVSDPFLEQQLKAASSAYKGSSVYMFAWWTASATAQIA